MTDVVFLIGHIDLGSGRYAQILPGNSKIPKQTQLGLRHRNSWASKPPGHNAWLSCLSD